MGPFALVLYDTRETFSIQFPGPTGAVLNFVELLVELFWSLQVYQKENKPRTAKVGAISKAQNLKGRPFGLCETPAGCKKF